MKFPLLVFISILLTLLSLCSSNKNSEKRTALLESTKSKWIKSMSKGDIDSKEEKNIYLGEGAKRRAEQIHLRSEMMDQAKSSVRSINQPIFIFESGLYNGIY